jgi:hypothetical protein
MFENFKFIIVNLSNHITGFKLLKFINLNYFFSKLSEYKLKDTKCYSNYNIDTFKLYVFNHINLFKNLFNEKAKFLFIFEIFLKNFFELKFKKNICLVFSASNLKNLTRNTYYLVLAKRLRRLKIFKRQSILIREMLEILTTSFYNHDILLFKNWLIRTAEKFHFKTHRKFFYTLKVIIIKYFK